MTNLHTTRESWLRAATDALQTRFEDAGIPLPSAIRFSIGFTSTGRKSKRIGECWDSRASADGHFEIFIRPDLADPTFVLGVLAHELVHAAVPSGSGHGPVFKKAALAIGLEGKMTQALPGADFASDLGELAADLGPLPHAALDINAGGADTPKKQTTRMIKSECDACGYTVRLARKWIDEVGAPHCPNHGEMTCDSPAGE